MDSWQEMTLTEQDRWIHSQVMGQPLDVPCTDGQIDPYMESYWSCTCGWRSDFHIGEAKSTEHSKPIPCYGLYWSAAWTIIPRIIDIGLAGAFREELKRLAGLPITNPIFLLEDIARWTPAMICEAAYAAIPLLPPILIEETSDGETRNTFSGHILKLWIVPVKGQRITGVGHVSGVDLKGNPVHFEVPILTPPPVEAHYPTITSIGQTEESNDQGE